MHAGLIMKAVDLNPGVKDSLQVFDIPSPEIEGNQALVRLVRVGVSGPTWS